MVTRRMELDQEVKTLKRNLGKQKEEFDSEVKILKRKLYEQKEEFDSEVKVFKKKLEEKEGEVDSSKSKINKQDRILVLLKDKIECPVCLDIPRSCPVPVCPNGHVVCKTCKKDSCPTCRTAMGTGTSILAGTVLENIEHRCKFVDCIENFALEDLEKHEVVCPYRTVNCPYDKCAMKAPLAKLLDHLINSELCFGGKPKVALEYWNRLNYAMKDVSRKKWVWRMHVFNYSGEIFAVLPIKSGGQYFFVMVMFLSEAECSKYEFEMIVHEQGSWALDSVMSVKFCGNPLSIDLKKEDLNLFGTSEQLMNKIMKKSIENNASDNSAFALSFKIFKKKNM